jgi:hypothetical protein
VSAARLYAMFPALRFSYERGAYVLRFIGETRGPVLRKDRRRNQQEYAGPDRREGGVDLAASRPRGNVRRIEVGEAARRTAGSAGTTGAATRAPDSTRPPDSTRRRPERADPSPRRRQHGRQRPPRPHR